MKRLEETFDLPSMGDYNDEQDFTRDLVKTSRDQNRDMLNELKNNDLIDQTLSSITGFEDHDREMDEISKKALQMFEDLNSLGMQVSDNNASKIFEVANGALKTALEARDAKTSRKLKQLDLMIKKQKIDNDSTKGKPEAQGQIGEGVAFSREELLELIMKTPVQIDTSIKSDK